MNLHRHTSALSSHRRRILPPSNNRPTYVKHELKKYNKVTVLRVLAVYKNPKAINWGTLAKLYSLRISYGTQFLLDLFVASEIYITHYPSLDVRMLRKEITTVLSQIPDYALKHEQI